MKKVVTPMNARPSAHQASTKVTSRMATPIPHRMTKDATQSAKLIPRMVRISVMGGIVWSPPWWSGA